MSDVITPDTLITEVFPRLKPLQLSALKRLNLKTLEDLLYHLPTRYVSISGTEPITNLVEGDRMVLFGTASNLKATKSYRSKITMATGRLEDSTGYIDMVWFNQPYIARMIPEGAPLKIEGKVASRAGKLYISNPEFEVLESLPNLGTESLFSQTQADQTNIEIDDQFIETFYPESRGITSNWISHAINKLFSLEVHHALADPIPESVLNELHLPDLATTMVWLHTPKQTSDADIAKKRLAFQEIFTLQVINAQENHRLSHSQGFVISNPDLKPVIASLPFKLTKAQNQVVKAVVGDLGKNTPMNRLVEGDVGSGKTIVAALALYAVVTSHLGKGFDTLQAALMAPTEILARQHYEGLQKLLGPLGITIGLLVGSGGEIFPSKLDPDKSTTLSKTQLKKYVLRGDVDIVIGTHALIYKTLQFKRLGLVVIDEQHRFGVRQRQALARDKEGIMPHLLSMTATPIPRTLALTLYGTLDLSLIDELPPGRVPVITSLVKGDDRELIYESLRRELLAGRQGYIVCARKDIADADKRDSLNLKSVSEVANHLRKKIFPDFKIGELHGSMTASEKDQIMNDFAGHKIDLLVTTTVIEVGVNVANASIIVIEDAGRYGLSQLHQLRGRVLRASHQPYCFVTTNSNSDASIERLQLLCTIKNGFELAEYDLMKRGPGALIGKRQSGISDTAMTALRNLKLVQIAQEQAKIIVSEDPELYNHPDLADYVDRFTKQLHLE